MGGQQTRGQSFVGTHYSKYRTMTMGKQNENISVNVDKGRIESCNSLRLYGVDIDRQLRFTEHISTVCKKSSQQVGVIMRLSN